MASLILSVLIVVGLVSVLIISQTGAEALAGKGYSDLSSEQKQKYWDCFKGKCKALLKEAQSLKNYTAYRECSLNCNALAQSSSLVWCNDTDNGLDYFKKGTVFSNVYANGKEDECKEFSNGKVYLKEGRCKNNKYSYQQKKCGELGSNFYCDFDLDLCKEKVPIIVCGNNKLEGDEECDDGNSINNDGCSQSCKDECIDSDGSNVNIAGYVYYQGEKIYDQCSTGIFGAAGTESVKESLCLEGLAGYQFIYCPQNYVCKESACIEKDGPKVYSGPGTYTLYVGDSVVNKNFNYILKDVTEPTEEKWDFSVVGELIVTLPNNFIFTNQKDLLKLYPKSLGGPWNTEFGTNYLLQNGSFNQIGENSTVSVTISFYEDCIPIYNYCKEMNIKTGSTIYCDAICEYTTKLPDRDYSSKENVIVSMPSGYSTALEVAAQNAQNCYNAITNLFGVKSKISLSVAYVASTTNTCNIGDYYGNVFCKVSPIYSNENINNNPNFINQQEKVMAGICTGDFGTIMLNQAHEMTHKYLILMVPIMNALLGEGMATFVQNSVVDLGNNNQLICQDTGYYYTNLPNQFYLYNPLSSTEYGTGACFLKDIKDKYGIEKFQAIFKYASTLNIGCHYLFIDIINPVVGEDAFSIFKEKYKLTKDPKGCSWQTVTSS